MFNDQRGIAFHETRQLTSKKTEQYPTDVVGQWAIRHWPLRGKYTFGFPCIM